MSGKAPGAPDYTGAAVQSALIGQDITRNQTFANRPNINLADGSGISWDVQPGTQYGPGGSGYGGGSLTSTSAGTGNDGLASRAGVAGRPQRMGGGSTTPGPTPANGVGGAATPQQGGSGPTPAPVPGGTPNNPATSTGTGVDTSQFSTPDLWTMNVHLNPTQQATLLGQEDVAKTRTDMANTLAGQATDQVANGGNFWGGLGSMPTGDSARQQAIDAAYGQATSRLDPQWQQQQTSLQQQLYGQGLREGDQAYDNAMGNFSRSKNDAYTSAMNSAIGQGTAAGQAVFGQGLQSRQQGISEGLQQQYGGMNALNALLAGQQVSMPQAPGFNTAGASQAPNLLGASQAAGQYGLGAAQLNQAAVTGAMQGGGALAGSLFGF